MNQAVDLSNVAVTVVDRKWMKMSKAWRISLRLPEGIPLLAPVLSGMIEKQFRIELRNSKGTIEIDPAIIIDVPPKNKTFLLQIETCYEHQNNIGPHVTAMMNEDAQLYIGKPFSKPAPAVGMPEQQPPLLSSDDEEYRKKLVSGLHVLFQNVRFQQFIQSELQRLFPGNAKKISNHLECKAVLKSLSQVASCRDLSIEQINGWREGFTEWVNRGAR